MRSQISSLFCSSSLLQSLGGGLGMKMIDDYEGGGEFLLGVRTKEQSLPAHAARRPSTTQKRRWRDDDAR